MGELIKGRLGVNSGKTSVCRLFNKMLGLSLQKPLWRAYLQSPESELNDGRITELPATHTRAKREYVEIWFSSDEAGIRSDAHAGTMWWSLKGKTLIISCTGASLGLNVILTVSPQGIF